jgi:predicted AAA+ superfamily ATPase
MDGLYLIISALIGAAATIASVLISRRSKAARDPILNETQNNENIYAALQFLLEEMCADRAYILQFHNGGYYVSGRSQQKFSCTHEIVQPGISRECLDSQNHIVSNFHTYISELTKDKKFAYTDCGDVPDHVFSSMMENKGVKSIYNVPITTLNNKVIGILGVDYVKDQASNNCIGFCPEERKNEFGEKTHEFMKRQSRVIAGYLI